MSRATTLGLVAIACWAGAGCVPDPGRPEPAEDVYQLIVDAEDARPAGGDTLALLVDAAGLDVPLLRRTAVRALGRLENPGLAGSIARHLADADPTVRAAAAEALAQSVHGRDGSPVLEDLLGRVGNESDPTVMGMLARSLGRLRVDADGRRRVTDALLELGGATPATAPLEVRVGLALGVESLVRGAPGEGLDRPAADLLVGLMTPAPDATADAAGDDAGRVRALAVSALGQTRRLSLGLIERALDDPEPEVRRVVLAYLDAVPPSLRDGLVARALADTSFRVATAAVRYLAAEARTAPRCDRLMSAAAAERPPALRIPALEALARPCPNFSVQRASLVAAASELGGPGAWQPATRALLSLAGVDAAAAARLLPTFAAHDDPFVRTWAARTAAAIRDAEGLFRLAVDASPNVRNEAVRGLFAMEGHGLDDFLVQQLEADDPQLLMTVAELLEGAPERARVSLALLRTFERISAAEWETWRDARGALLERIAELGDASLAERLVPFVGDYDPVVAEGAAALLERWTGQSHEAAPAPLPRAPVPTRAEVAALDGATLTLHLRGGGALVVELLAHQATTNVARLVRLAESGYYDGLTFHRWAANFVVQGGSPGANEYAGDGPYTRDEVGGLSHWRGTVGLSTRGRDTGDGQIFINLVDNPRLNHDYTVLGRLTQGHDVLDSLLEGAAIERAVVTRPR